MNHLSLFLCLLCVLGIALPWPAMLLGTLYMIEKIANYMQPFALEWYKDYLANQHK